MMTPEEYERYQAGELEPDAEVRWIDRQRETHEADQLDTAVLEDFGGEVLVPAVNPLYGVAAAVLGSYLCFWMPLAGIIILAKR